MPNQEENIAAQVVGLTGGVIERNGEKQVIFYNLNKAVPIPLLVLSWQMRDASDNLSAYWWHGCFSYHQSTSVTGDAPQLGMQHPTWNGQLWAGRDIFPSRDQPDRILLFISTTYITCSTRLAEAWCVLILIHDTTYSSQALFR